MPTAPYPESITSLPLADIPIDGVTGRLLQGPDSQVVFFDIEPIGVIPPHRHGEQWGLVVEGEMELTIGGETRTYRAGDSYHIPAGVVHGATFATRVRVIDFFADRERYRTRAPAEG
jgi:quercetin dioxygenase-like cupin family protein